VVVQEDQLSLAIGRDGQNARLAAKLTGWRIDIKSLIEAAGDAIAKLQGAPSFANIAEAEHKNIPLVEGILTKKTEGRPVTPEEFMTLIQFVERVERRTLEQKKATAAAEEERVSAARAEIPIVAFDMGVDVLGLADHIYNILTEAEHRTVGDLMLALKLNPDSVLGLAGIGPKSMEAIQTALNNATFPEPEPVVEPVIESVAAMPVEGITEMPAEPVQEIIAPAEVLPESVNAEAEPVLAEGEPLAEIVSEKPLEEIFTLRPDMLQPVAVAADEDEDESDKKKGKKKKKKVVEIVYDEDLNKAIAKIKHKRGDEGWEED
jgi:N utilization substance protein A